MKARRAALAGVIAIAVGAAGAAPVDIAWMRADVGPLKSPHGAMLVPVASGGLECLMQVDTGMPTTVFYRGAVPAAWLDKSADRVTAPGLAVGGTRIPDTGLPFYPGDMADRNEPPCSATNRDVLVGTIGLDSLKTGSIVIDLAAARFEFIERGVLSASTTSRSPVFRFATPDGLEPARPVFEVSGPHGARYRMLLDTGSAAIGALFLRERDWLAETPSASRTPPFQFTRWGGPASARLGHGRLEIVPAGAAPAIVDNIALFTATADALADNNPLDGYLGLLPFENQRLTIDFVDRLARVEPSHANP